MINQPTTEGTTMAARRTSTAVKTSTTVTPIQATGRSVTGDNGGGRKPKTSPAKPASTATAKPVATAEPSQPTHTATIQPYPKTFYQPVIDGQPVTCEHMTRYGHDSEKAALACARKLASQRAAA